MSKNPSHPSEALLLTAGLALLLSLPLIALWGSFVVWMAAKALYGIGVILFLMNK